MPDVDPRDVIRRADAIAPLLAGKSPEYQGAVLAELLARFLAGTHPGLREEILALHIAAVRSLIGPNEEEIFKRRGGKPPGWTPN